MLSLEFVLGLCHGIAKRGDCKVEILSTILLALYCKVEILSTILLALFCAKFACILAINNSVFRWESCKGSV